MLPLEVLPCLDSPEHAERCRRDLDIPRDMARVLGRDAVELARDGATHASPLRIAIRAAVAAKRSIPPDVVLPVLPAQSAYVTRVQVTNESTLSVARRLVARGERPLALNFANGAYPGGGFLSGSRAQEECLCRSSTLWHTLVGDPMYAAHLKRPTADSTDWAILSPEVPVFLADDATALDAHWPLDILTCAAPVAQAIGVARAAALLRPRIHRVLDIACAFQYDVLILGAWGCGAFGNDPLTTARDFRAALDGPFAGVFREVHFAIADWSAERRYLGPFRDVFAGVA